MLRIIAGCEIELDGGAFEDSEAGRISGLVDDGGNAAVGYHEKQRRKSQCQLLHVKLDSVRLRVLPKSQAGTRLRLIFRNHSSFCSFFAISILRTE